jgi:hypothetical protein
MSPEGAKILVILGLGTAVISTTVSEIQNGHRAPSFYVPLGGALVAIPLLIMSDFEPNIAGGLALLILVSSLVYSGGSIMSAVNTATGQNPTNPASRTLQTPTSRIG